MLRPRRYPVMMMARDGCRLLYGSHVHRMWTCLRLHVNRTIQCSMLDVSFLLSRRISLEFTNAIDADTCHVLETFKHTPVAGTTLLPPGVTQCF